MKRSADPVALGAGVGALGAVAAGLLGGLCCAGPFVVAVLGAGGVVAAARLSAYRPYLLGAAGLLLVLGFWRAYRPGLRARRVSRAALERPGAFASSSGYLRYCCSLPSS